MQQKYKAANKVLLIQSASDRFPHVLDPGNLRNPPTTGNHSSPNWVIIAHPGYDGNSHSVTLSSNLLSQLNQKGWICYHKLWYLLALLFWSMVFVVALICVPKVKF